MQDLWKRNYSSGGSTDMESISLGNNSRELSNPKLWLLSCSCLVLDLMLQRAAMSIYPYYMIYRKLVNLNLKFILSSSLYERSMPAIFRRITSRMVGSHELCGASGSVQSYLWPITIEYICNIASEWVCCWNANCINAIFSPIPLHISVTKSAFSSQTACQNFLLNKVEIS